MDKRQFKRLKRKAKKAEKNINLKIVLRMRELRKDPEFMRKVESELDKINSRSELNRYLEKAFEISKKESQVILNVAG